MRLALLPGLDGTGLLFEPLISALPPELDPFVVQYPRNRTNLITDHVDVAAAALSGGGTWLLVAESFSGPIAARMITERPELDIAGVVFCASFLTPPKRPLLALARRAPLQAAFGIPLPDWVFRTVCLGSGADRSTIALLRQALSCAGSDALAARLRMLSWLPAYHEHIAIPALYIRATKDRLVGPESTHDVARHCRQIETIEIDGPHFILQARPESCAKAIAAFAGSLRRQPPAAETT